MTAADDAFQEAERLIEQARQEGRSTLDLEFPKIHALTTLPESIFALENLQTLFLTKTQITDTGAAQIARLENLQDLFLNNTQITDAGAAQIARMENLQILHLDNTQITDTGAAQIARLENLQFLFFDSTQITDTGAAQIAQMKNLQRLSLANTQITDTGAAQIARMENLRSLWLNNTRIQDLRPLARLTNLGDEGFHPCGLHFKNTPACDLDPRIKTLSEIEDGPERTAALFDYLNSLTDWPPLPETLIPQDAVLSVIQTPDGQLDVAPATPDEAELHDPVKQHLHTFLKSASQALADAAGNMYPRIATTARELLAMLDQPLDQVDLLAVHLQLEDLRGTFERRGERVGENILSADVVDALDKVVNNGPGLTLDNAVVEALEKRKARYASPPENPDLQPAQDAVSDAIALDPALFGDVIRGYSVTFKHNSGNTDRIRAGQDTLNKNTVIKTGTKVALWIAGGMASGILGNMGTNSLSWLTANSDYILTLAASWGPSFEAWITPILMRAQQAYDAMRTMIGRP